MRACEVRSRVGVGVRACVRVECMSSVVHIHLSMRVLRVAGTDGMQRESAWMSLLSV